jgi:hypothetical protein
VEGVRWRKGQGVLQQKWPDAACIGPHFLEPKAVIISLSAATDKGE